MSKTKKQCLNIIYKYFSDKEIGINFKNSLIILENSIKDIVDPEYSFVWQYDNLNNRVIHNEKILILDKSILKSTLTSKKVFFTNDIREHNNYNEIIDNPLNIKLKSIIILPIIFQEDKFLGFLVGYNSSSYGYDFKRYDTRLFSLLEENSKKIFLSSLKNKNYINNEIIEEKEIKEKNESIISEIKNDKELLENRVKIQEQRIQELERLLEEDRKPKQELIVVEEAINVPTESENYKELKLVINFLNNELNYFSESKNVIYAFLEIIKNSLHDIKQLEYIEEKLTSSQLVNSFIDNLQNIEHRPLDIEKFKTYQELISIISIYSKVFAKEELFFNVFIDPKIPSELLGDKEKIQSLIVHMFNNINCLTKQYGRIEFLVKYNKEEALLKLVVSSIPAIEKKKLFNFFKKKTVTNSLTTNNSGLGLSIASNLIKILNGKLKLKTEKNGKHAFIVSIPCLLLKSNKSNKIFKSKQNIKIAILMEDNHDDKHYFYNLIRYFEGFDISKENIVVINNYKKLKGKNFSHLFCFENLFSDKIYQTNIPSITILRYNNIILNEDKSSSTHELYLNGYYGISLQEILFPDMIKEDIDSNTFLFECRLNKKKKDKKLNNYVGQLRSFN